MFQGKRAAGERIFEELYLQNHRFCGANRPNYTSNSPKSTQLPTHYPPVAPAHDLRARARGKRLAAGFCQGGNVRGETVMRTAVGG